jgi:hypothetical protein
MTILDFIVFVFIIAVVSYFAYRSGFEEGQAAANRKHTQQLCRLRNENGILDKRTVKLFSEIDEIKERLHTAETKIKFATNILYGRKIIVKGEMPNGAADCEVVNAEKPHSYATCKYGNDIENPICNGCIHGDPVYDRAIKDCWEE